ncbi:MAG: alpha/beta hydrolase [Cyanobacteria bacterium P01_A01_bin.84]
MNYLFRNSRIKLSQGLLFWREIGEGTSVIFLHGAWSDSSQWVSLMENLARNMQCIAPDLLGFGESEYPDIHYCIDLQLECLEEFLQALKLDKILFVGDSLGAWIASSYACKHPEKVSGLVLLSPFGVETENWEKYCQQMQRLLERSPLAFGLMQIFRPVLKLFGNEVNIEADLKQKQVMEEYPVATQMLFKRPIPEILADTLNERLPFLDVPVLVLQGAEDEVNAIDRSQTFYQLTPRGSLKMIAHAESDLPSSCTGLVAEEVREFIVQQNLQHTPVSEY